jgi:hypothetical protein
MLATGLERPGLVHPLPLFGVTTKVGAFERRAAHRART